MPKLVSLQQARDHLRSDDTADDNDLDLKIKAASKAVLTYLKPEGVARLFEVDSAGDPVEDSDGLADDVPEDIAICTLLLVGIFYSEREGQGGWDPGYLPPAVTALLYPYRDPTME